MEDYRLEQSGQEVQNILNGAAMQTDLTAENERAELAEQTLQGNIDDEALARENADIELQGHIDDEETRAKAAEKQNADDIDAIEEKIPTQASSSNQLADKDFVEDLVSTSSATFRGTFNLVSDLHLTVDASYTNIAAALGNAIAGADNNDFAFVMIPTSVDTPNEIARIEKYKFNGSVWGFEYVLNNSGFTAAQWAAINSGITSALVTKLGALPSAADLAAALLAKQDKLTFDQAPTPSSTNPVTSGGVYTAIDDEKGARVNADAALQQAIEAILLLIPSAATALNQLADKDFVNSSITTATATFRGTFNLVSDLQLTVDATHTDIAAALLNAISTADNNDYVFVQIPTSVDTPTEIRVTERYKFNGTSWQYEYDLNNSGFTAAQWEAINSGITTLLVTKLSNLPNATELAALFAGKQNVLTFDNAPVSGSDNPVKSGGLYDLFAAIDAKMPTGASANNKLVAEDRLAAYVGGIIGALDATFDLTSADGHVTIRMTQTDGVITSLQILTSDIASASALTTLGGQVSTNADDIAALQDAYAALTQSDVVVGALPSSGQQQNIIYRQPDQDHTPPQFYSDYMWNGSTWVLMATYNNAIDPRPKKASQNLVTSGGVFDNMGALDISELNATENPHALAQYVDLSAALAAVPIDYQKGGMSIKFVQSSDNKYVQYRLMAQNFNTDTTQWQGVDDEPTAESENLIESGAAWKTKELSLQNLANISDNTALTPDSVYDNHYVNRYNEVAENSGYQINKYEASEGDCFIVKGRYEASITPKLATWFDSNDEIILVEPYGGSATEGVTIEKCIQAPAGTSYLGLSVVKRSSSNFGCKKITGFIDINGDIAAEKARAEAAEASIRETMDSILTDKKLAETTTTFTGDESSAKYLVYKLETRVIPGEKLKIAVSGLGTTIQYYNYSINQGTEVTKGGDTNIDVDSVITRIDVKVNANRVLAAGDVTCTITKYSPISSLEENVDSLVSENYLQERGLTFTSIENITWTDNYYIDTNGNLTSSNNHSYSSPIAVKANDYLRGVIEKHGGYPALAWVIQNGNNIAYVPFMMADDVIDVTPAANDTPYPFRVRMPKDGNICIITRKVATNVPFSIERGQGERVNSCVENAIGLTDNLNLVKADTVNLFDPKECVNKKGFNANGVMSTNNAYWTSGFVPVSSDYIRFNYPPIHLVVYDNSFVVKEVFEDLNAYTYIFNINKTAHPERSYIRFDIQQAKLSYEEREKLIVVNSIDNADITAPSVINTDFINSKPRGYVTLNDIKQYGADIVKGVYVSETVFNDDNGDAVTLNTSKIYLDRASNNMYRYDGSALYYLCYWDNKSVPFTSDFKLYIARNEYSEQNMIVTANARYFRGNSVTDVPTIQFRPRCGFANTTASAGSIRATIKYTIGNEYGFIKREWRPWPLNKIQDRTQINVVVPAGVTLFIDNFGNYYSDKKTVGSYPILNCRQTNALGQTLAAFEMIIRTGYDHVIAIPKKCADGTWVVFHDDGTINQSSPSVINNDNGTQITDNPKMMTECNYDELLGYDMGLGQAAFMNLAYAGQKVPLLEDFLMMCAKTGVHPVFSVHPYFSSSDWAEVKSLTDKWGVTKNLGLKGGNFSSLLAATYPVFGDNIESYFNDVNDTTAIATHISNMQSAISTYGIDTDKVQVGIELFYAYASDANIIAVREAGLPCAVVASEQSITSEDYLHWIRLGVSQFTDSFNPSVGLNW